MIDIVSAIICSPIQDSLSFHPRESLINLSSIFPTDGNFDGKPLFAEICDVLTANVVELLRSPILADRGTDPR